MQNLLLILIKHSDPWYWISIAILLCVIILINPLPLSTEKEVSFASHVVMYVRRLLLIVLLLLMVCVPLMIALLAYGLSQDSHYVQKVMHAVFIQKMMQHWSLLAAGIVGGIFFKLLGLRYLLPVFSGWYTHRRVAQRGDSPSDIRAEAARLKPKQFTPSDHYQADQLFLGLNSQSKPIRIPVEQWKTENQKIIGPTQTGKGVLIGVQLDQAIRQHMTTIFIDPKPDKHAYHIMQQACTDAGRTFLTLDFNGHLPQGKWAPFRHGTEREVKTRLYTALGLLETGNESDFFKIKERRMIDRLYAKWDGEIRSLYKALEAMDTPPERALSVVGEYTGLKTINPSKHRGIDMERVLKENAVLYVRGSIVDPLIIQITTILIQCILQCAMRLYTTQERAAHLFLCIDEVRFMVSDLMADTLATITGTDAHLTIAYQSLEDIRNIKDVNVNAKSVEKSINVNCKSSVYYQAADFETAEYASEQTGTRQVARYRFNVNQNLLGGETYDSKHMITQEDQPYINPNTLLMLPERIALYKRPNQLAELLYTAWINVSESHLVKKQNNITHAKQDQDKAIMKTPPKSSVEEKQFPQIKAIEKPMEISIKEVIKLSETDTMQKKMMWKFSTLGFSLCSSTRQAVRFYYTD